MPQVGRIETLTDRDGDVVMSDTSIPSLNPFKDKFNIDWFSFDTKLASPKSPISSPASPTQALNLSASTASPSSYFSKASFDAGAISQDLDFLADTPLPEVKYPSPPAKPLRWIWQCHQCSARYPLAVTRRCLADGHYYCSGNSPSQRNMKKRRKQQSCTSEFDYVAWKEWGQWRRKTMALRAFAAREKEPKLLGCEGCSSPSQCRYEKRRPVETIKFEDFIQPEDLVMNDEESTSSDHSIHGAKLKSSKRSSTSSPKGEEDARSRKSTSKKSPKADTESSSPTPSQKSLGRYRFYSNLSGSLPNRDLSPTSDSLRFLDRGKFDPTLPSVAKSSAEGSDLTAIESTLRAALTKRNQHSPPPTTLRGIGQSTLKPKRRTNTKVGDPQFEITAKEIQDRSRAGGGPGSLQRTTSQPSLLTDFFRQSKTRTNIEPDSADNADRAASEADITAFLQSTPSWNLEEVKSRTKKQFSAQANNVQHFEDIDLSTVSEATLLRETSPAEDSEKRDSCSIKSDMDTRDTQVNTAGETVRAGIGFALPSFVFGRK